MIEEEFDIRTVDFSELSNEDAISLLFINKIETLRSLYSFCLAFGKDPSSFNENEIISTKAYSSIRLEELKSYMIEDFNKLSFIKNKLNELS